MKFHKGEDYEANSTVQDRIDRQRLNCSRCKPHRRENAGRVPRDDHGKNKRRGR